MAGRSVDDEPQLESNLVDGRLMHRQLSAISKLRGNSNEFVKTCLMTRMNNLEFKTIYGNEGQIPVGKLVRLMSSTW